MTAILGISAFFHDSAAAILVDGEVVAAAQEERFSRRKHDASFPQHAIQACLKTAGLRPDQLDHVGFYEKPLLKFDRILETALATAPWGFRAFWNALPQWLHDKLHVPRRIREGLEGRYRKRLWFVPHHESHAASAFYSSPFDEAAIVTMDGVGEWTTTGIGVGEGNRLRFIKQHRFPHSLGLLYSALTHYCGFRVNGGEYKLMGLAPYGTPAYRDWMLRELIDLQDDGSFRLNLKYFHYCHGLTMTSRRLHRELGGPPREPESPLTQKYMDLAASIQAVTEEVVFRVSRHARHVTKKRDAVFAGGVALNCVAMGKLQRAGIFDRVWVQPASGDAGGALGTAQFIWHQLLGMDRCQIANGDQTGGNASSSSSERTSPSHYFLGPIENESLPSSVTDDPALAWSRMTNEEELCRAVAEDLAAGRVVGWFQGRMEFGPRALGNRSLLADPRDPGMRDRLNLKTKRRESFRPFAPIVLAERVHEWFDVPCGWQSPYMMFTAPVREDRRSLLPAITHVDGSARIQTVSITDHPRLHRLLTAFAARTDCPVLVNTSFNVRGEPIVCTREDALRCFQSTGIDILVMHDWRAVKKGHHGP